MDNEQYEGVLETLDTVGADYLPIYNVNNPLSIAHIQYPFALFGFRGDQIVLLGQATSAIGALEGLEELHAGLKGKDWKYKLSDGFQQILDIEVSQRASITKSHKFHKEDLIPLPPGFEGLLTRGNDD